MSVPLYTIVVSIPFSIIPILQYYPYNPHIILRLGLRSWGWDSGAGSGGMFVQYCRAGAEGTKIELKP